MLFDLRNFFSICETLLLDKNLQKKFTFFKDGRNFIEFIMKVPLNSDSNNSTEENFKQVYRSYLLVNAFNFFNVGVFVERKFRQFIEIRIRKQNEVFFFICFLKFLIEEFPFLQDNLDLTEDYKITLHIDKFEKLYTLISNSALFHNKFLVLELRFTQKEFKEVVLNFLKIKL